MAVDRDVVEWTVVWGNGDQRRRRLPDGYGEEEIKDVEKSRIKGMAYERDASLVGMRMSSRSVVARKR